MKSIFFKISAILAGLLIIASVVVLLSAKHSDSPPQTLPESTYWLLLKRKSNQEFLYKGEEGNVNKSSVVRKFTVKTGIPGERPTPLPSLSGRKYWLITKKEVSTNPETAPYFLTLDVPGTDEEPYGPVPYRECQNKQCNWVVPGSFGLHGVNGDMGRLASDNPGSSGCVRHSDEDITYLYKTLHPEKGPIRYYIVDS